MQYVDIKTYLADDILTKVDRMSMAASIETRVPLLDHNIVEFALNLPPQMKLNGSRTKSILRNTVRHLVPEMILSKPKQGFSIPMKHWLRTTLKPLMLDLLSNDALRRQGYFAPEDGINLDAGAPGREGQSQPPLMVSDDVPNVVTKGIRNAPSIFHMISSHGPWELII
jgi:asparagine synthetase B (glutamine-hydrolysing)